MHPNRTNLPFATNPSIGTILHIWPRQIRVPHVGGMHMHAGCTAAEFPLCQELRRRLQEVVDGDLASERQRQVEDLANKVRSLSL